MVPWGPPPHMMAISASPKDAGGGGEQEPGSRVALPRLCSISHCRGWAPSPLHPPPPRLHLSPFQGRYPGSLRRKGGAESTLVFVRAVTAKSSEISPCTAGEAHIQAREPRSSCCKRDTAAREVLARPPSTPYAKPRHGSALSPPRPNPLCNPPLPRANLLLPEPTLQNAAPLPPHPKFAAKFKAGEELGGPQGEVMVAGGSPPSPPFSPPTPPRLTSLHAQHRSKHSEQKRLHGAAMGPRRCAGAAGGAQGWR